MRLAKINTTDIRGAVQLGCRTMCSVFNADDRDIPFFGSTVRPVAGLFWSDVHGESHVPGRHLNALLAAEAALSLEVSPEAVAKHAAAARFSYGGPLPLPLNRERVDGPLVLFNDHNLREGFHALYALARFRRARRDRDVHVRCAPIIRLSTAPGPRGRLLLGRYTDDEKRLERHPAARVEQDRPDWRGVKMTPAIREGAVQAVEDLKAWPIRIDSARKCLAAARGEA